MNKQKKLKPLKKFKKEMQKEKPRKSIIDIISTKNRLALLYVLSVGLILAISLGLVVVLNYFLIQTKLLAPDQNFEDNIIVAIVLFALSAIALGLAISAIMGKVILKPVNTLIDGMDKLAQGDYKTRITRGKLEGMKGLADGFNTLAGELENTEILRSDFINNFSHEIKTPVVSISTLIGLMKSDKISKEKQLLYLDIIDEEVNRLADMTTNMLNLSRVERTDIVVDKKSFNVSEQIRTVVLLLERKWAKKKLTFSLDFDEFNIVGNEDMFKQVWFNLIDNAIKFCDDKSEITVSVQVENEMLKTEISNVGKDIPQADLDKIFNKFYRVENAEKKDGNGIGLSIVKRIVQLHDGSIDVKSNEGITTFSVNLPISA